MENSLFAVIIKVKNLDICRTFYRDILALGEPALDSNFWVEFKLANSFTLAFEKVERKNASEADNVAWSCQIDNIEAIKSRLDEYGYHVRLEKSSRIGMDFYSCHDPEGNLFYLRVKPWDELESNLETLNLQPGENSEKKEWKTIRVFKTPGCVKTTGA